MSRNNYLFQACPTDRTPSYHSCSSCSCYATPWFQVRFRCSVASPDISKVASLESNNSKSYHIVTLCDCLWPHPTFKCFKAVQKHISPKPHHKWIDLTWTWRSARTVNLKGCGYRLATINQKLAATCDTPNSLVFGSQLTTAIFTTFTMRIQTEAALPKDPGWLKDKSHKPWSWPWILTTAWGIKAYKMPLCLNIVLHRANPNHNIPRVLEFENMCELPMHLFTQPPNPPAPERVRHNLGPGVSRNIMLSCELRIQRGLISSS